MSGQSSAACCRVMACHAERPAMRPCRGPSSVAPRGAIEASQDSCAEEEGARRTRALFTMGMALALFAAAPGMVAPSGPAQTSVLAPLKTPWEHTRPLGEGLVAHVPEDQYDGRPRPEVRSFREPFTHLIGENCRFMAQVAGETAPLEMSAIETLNGRDAMIQALKGSDDYGATVWTGMTDPKALELIAGRGGQPQRQQPSPPTPR
jgi:hypothetical protein